MARLSDLIEDFIKQMLADSDEDILEIQRNELANSFKCAPSQINYVLTTRFTIDKGYYVESRRGGGGCIKIKRANIDKNDYIRKSIWDNIGDKISQQDARDYIELFLERSFITEREAKLMDVVTSDKTLGLDSKTRDSLRSNLLKTMLIALIN
jgi:transcriptional regulator CtsR